MATPSTPPAVVTIGDLYVDAQTQALWLGVDVSVDPAGSIPIADYNYFLELFAENAIAANAYADAQVATRAALSHTHVSSQITDFNAAVNALITSGPSAALPIGAIVMWGGSLADIGVGALVNWALCNGLGGTPDLRDRFITGAGNVAIGTLNGAATAATSAAGAHTPAITGTTLALANIPAHHHALSGNTVVAGAHSHGGSALTAGSHTHLVAAGYVPASFGGDFQAVGNLGGTSASTTAAGTHTHTILTDTEPAHSHTLSGNTADSGGGTLHTHLASAVPDHTHTVSSANLRAALPYYALAYIKKIA